MRLRPPYASLSSVFAVAASTAAMTGSVNLAPLLLLLAPVALELSVTLTCAHKMEVVYENMNDVGPMERPGYFEEAYGGSDLGYRAVGKPYYKPLPVPKLIIKRRYVPKSPFRSATSDERPPLWRAIFGLSPGNLPLDLVPTISNAFSWESGLKGNFDLSMSASPAKKRKRGPIIGSGSVKEDVDQTGVVMSPERYNGW